MSLGSLQGLERQPGRHPALRQGYASMAEDRSVLTRSAPAPERVLAYGDSPDQVVDVYPGHRSTALVLIHGGYWRPEYDRIHLRPMATALADAGWTTYLIEYRREPGNPRAMADDVRAAIKASAADSDGARLLLIGHSAGGHLALTAAAGDQALIHGVIALAPLADLTSALALDLDDGAAQSYLGAAPVEEHCPIAQPSPEVPVLIVHGDKDELVPIELSRTYARTHPVTALLEIPGGTHFALIDPQSSIWPRLLEVVASSAQSTSA